MPQATSCGARARVEDLPLRRNATAAYLPSAGKLGARDRVRAVVFADESGLVRLASAAGSAGPV